MEWKLFGDLAQRTGERRIAIDADTSVSVRDAVEALLAAHPELRDRVLTADGTLREHIDVLKNDVTVRAADGLDTVVDAGDELSLVPAVRGAQSGRQPSRSPARR